MVYQRFGYTLQVCKAYGKPRPWRHRVVSFPEETIVELFGRLFHFHGPICERLYLRLANRARMRSAG